MILTDYFTSDYNITWDFARQMGVTNGVIRLPEHSDFDISDFSCWKKVHDRFTAKGIKPIVIEPLPNELHDHIKTGDKMRDACIEKFIKALQYMNELDIRTLCFNFMAHVGWTRTSERIPERGGALVTGFDISDFTPPTEEITQDELWHNYEYFVHAVVPYAEKYNIKLALHPDDPPIEKLGGVTRIMTSLQNIEKAIRLAESPNLGVTFCQATYLMMGEDLKKAITELSDKIFFIHFRNCVGNKYKFNETFHDNGSIDMAEILLHYRSCGVDVPIRVDHVPLMAGEQQETAGYTALGRLYAIGYLKGLLEMADLHS